MDAGERALLTDFGISRLLDGSIQYPQTGFTIGTASYLAPEQVYGHDLTPAVDLYALGLVLLDACTGQREYPDPGGGPCACGCRREPTRSMWRRPPRDLRSSRTRWPVRPRMATRPPWTRATPSAHVTHTARPASALVTHHKAKTASKVPRECARMTPIR